MNQLHLDRWDWHVKFEITARAEDDGDFGSFITSIHANVMLLDEGEETKQIGTAMLQIIHADRADNEGGDLFVACDANSQELYEVWEEIYNTHKVKADDKFWGLSKKILTMFENDVPTNRDTLLIEMVQINPEYRGQDLGLDVVDAAINTFGNGAELEIVERRAGGERDAHRLDLEPAAGALGEVTPASGASPSETSSIACATARGGGPSATRIGGRTSRPARNAAPAAPSGPVTTSRSPGRAPARPGTRSARPSAVTLTTTGLRARRVAAAHRDARLGHAPRTARARPRRRSAGAPRLTIRAIGSAPEAARSLRLTAAARKPSSRHETRSKRKCTPSTSASCVTTSPATCAASCSIPCASPRRSSSASSPNSRARRASPSILVAASSVSGSSA